jgi:hypothetical protein
MLVVCPRYGEEDMKIETEVEEFPQMEGCISPEDYVELWRFTRLRTGRELFGLLVFEEMIDRTENPLHQFTSACAAWLQVTRDEMLKDIEPETEEAASESLHSSDPDDAVLH